MIAVATLNIILGLVYTTYGLTTLSEMVKNRSTLGFSHFGAAWVAMAFTCGPHHWAHGIHLIQSGSSGGTLDLIAVLVGFPAGVIWFALRMEALTGGRGDRHISGTPGWIMTLPTLGGIYVTAMIAAALDGAGAASNVTPGLIANLMLVGLYSAIGYYLARTQIANRRPLGGWSLSGLALAVVFPTCAAMHGIYGYYELTGLYPVDTHMLVIDSLAVPAAIYFLWVVHALYRGSFRDWNGAPGVTPELPGPRRGALSGSEPALGTAGSGADGPGRTF